MHFSLKIFFRMMIVMYSGVGEGKGVRTDRRVVSDKQCTLIRWSINKSLDKRTNQLPSSSNQLLLTVALTRTRYILYVCSTPSSFLLFSLHLIIIVIVLYYVCVCVFACACIHDYTIHSCNAKILKKNVPKDAWQRCKMHLFPIQF